MSDKDPITDADWAKGATIDRWLEVNTPEAYREAVQNKTWVRTLPPSPSEDWKDRRYWPAVKQCRKELLRALEWKEIELRTRTRRPPNSELLTWELPPPDTVSEIVAKWSYGSRKGEAYLKELGRYVQVRAFRPRRWQDSTKFVRWAKERLEAKYKAGEALAAAGKPQDRKPKPEILSELRKEEPELSKTGAEKAWKKADIPKWKDPGVIKGRRRKPPHSMG